MKKDGIAFSVKADHWTISATEKLLRLPSNVKRLLQQSAAFFDSCVIVALDVNRSGESPSNFAKKPKRLCNASSSGGTKILYQGLSSCDNNDDVNLVYIEVL